MTKLTKKQKEKTEKELKAKLEALFSEGNYRVKVTVIDDDKKAEQPKQQEGDKR
jgi:flagellar biosynthesis/type III secretory pathway M-ring protein FliF/YscJ